MGSFRRTTVISERQIQRMRDMRLEGMEVIDIARAMGTSSYIVMKYSKDVKSFSADIRTPKRARAAHQVVL